MSRRSIIILVVALAVLGPLVLGGIAVLALGGDDSRRVGAIQKAFVGEKYALQGPSGSPVFLKSYEGCRRKADVSRAPNTAGVVRKQIVGVLEEPCVVHFGLEAPGLWQVVDGMLKGTATPQDYILTVVNFNNKVTAGVQLLNAVPTKFVIPQFDQERGKDNVTFELWLQPASLMPLPAGQIGTSIGSAQGKSVKNALVTNFSVELGSLPTTRVNKIGPIEVRWTPGKPPETNVGDVALSMSTIDSPAVHAWFEDFVVNGNNSPSDEKTATLKLLSQNLKDVLATFTLGGVGIIDVFDVTNSSGNKGNRTIFSVYAEELSLGTGLAPPPAPSPSPSPSPTPAPPPPPPAETTETAPAEETKLAAPAEIKGSASGRSEVELAWNAVDGAESYVILAALSTREDERPDFNEITESKETSILIGDLRPGTYLFVVRARAGEAESANSPTVEIVVE